MSPFFPPEVEPSPPLRSVDEIVSRLAGILTPSSVIVCVGNELIGDDGAGVAVAHALEAEELPWPVFNAQTVPESFLMKIVKCEPDVLVMVDALEIGAEPGTVRILPSRKLTGQSPSTHGPAPIAFLDIVKKMHPCRTAVLGIQPKAGVFGTGLSEPVAAAVDRIVRAFRILADKSLAE